MPQVGLKNFHYALLKSDDETAVTYDTVKAIKGLISADIKPSASSETLYADDGPYEADTVLGDVTITIETADLSLEQQAELLGHTISKGVLVSKSSDKAPYVAIAFESGKSNGAIRYVKVLKVRFEEQQDSTKTQGNKVAFQTPKLEGKAVCRLYDGQWKRTADTDATEFDAKTATNWYKAIEESTVTA